MHNTLERPDYEDTQPERLRQLNNEMLKLSMAERRLRWKHYYAQVDNLYAEEVRDQAQRYRTFYDDARGRIPEAPLETRDELMLIANLWRSLVKEYEVRLSRGRGRGKHFP